MLSVSLATATEPVYHKAEVREGEGAYALLRRYGLSDQESIARFYALNNMQPQDHLLTGKKYTLPVLIYTYDGKSIRSTIGINDWDMAVIALKEGKNE